MARPQLLEKLDEALTRRLTLVSAPAGAGKTTLVSAWAQGIRQRGAAAFGWLSLDEADNASGRFWEYLAACLEEGGAGLDSGSSLPENGETGSGAEVPAGLVLGLVNLNGQLILILDDYHLIQNKEIHSALGKLLEHTPPRLHLVLLTRSDPPLELARLRVLGQLVEIRMEQLRFSAQEAAAFLKKSADVHLSEAEAAMLNARAEGWVAGLQMAAISLRGRADAGAFVAAFAGSHRFVFDYLMEQVLSRQSAEVREFLLKTSVLERLSAPLCAVVAETGEARHFLDTLERDNLFLVPLDDERGWYRYHHLFADLLKLLLEQTYPGLAADLHRRASGWYEAQGMLPEALLHALSSRDMKRVAQIVSANVFVLIENDEVTPILQKIDALPPGEITAVPWLGIARTWIMSGGQIKKSCQILDDVEKSIDPALDEIEARRLRGHLVAARAFVLSADGDTGTVLAYARQADELLPTDEVSVRARNLNTWGNVLVGLRRDAEAISILEQAWELALQAQNPYLVMLAASSLATAHLFAGRFFEQQRICLEALAFADECQKRYSCPLSAAADVYPLLARVYAEWGENEKAIQFARKGLLLSEHWGLTNTERLCLCYLGRALVFGNDDEQARQVFQRADGLAQKISPWVWQELACFTLDSLLDSETPDVAEIEKLRSRIQAGGLPFPALLDARLFLWEGKPDQALAALEQADADSDGQPSFDTIRIYGLRALAFQTKGAEKQSLAVLRKALELGEPENRIASFVREGAAMGKLLRLAQVRFMAPAFVTRLLAACEARHKTAPGPVLVTASLIEPLSERELEILSMLDGPLSTPEIAGQLIVSANTVRTHIKNIYGKLDVHGRSGAVRRAQELGLLA